MLIFNILGLFHNFNMQTYKITEKIKKYLHNSTH